MTPDELKSAQSRYVAADEAYQRAARRVAQKLKDGRAPSAEEIEDEVDASEELAVARRLLLDLITRLAPRQ